MTTFVLAGLTILAVLGLGAGALALLVYEDMGQGTFQEPTKTPLPEK